jgi:uncharacterized protein (DUF1499 family)
MNKRYFGLMATMAILFGCSSGPPRNLGVKKERLAPCPDKPNCVSTQSLDPSRRMEPLPYRGTKGKSKDRIMEIIKGMERSKIVEVSDSYLYVQFQTRFLRFVDDVEFFLDDSERLIHFRSAARVGYYDFDLNRRRMEEISKLYGQK